MAILCAIQVQTFAGQQIKGGRRVNCWTVQLARGRVGLRWEEEGEE